MHRLVIAFLLLSIVTVAGMFGFYYALYFKAPEATQVTKPVMQIADSAKQDKNLISKHYLENDHKVYENTRVGYKINYPAGGVSIYDCPSTNCAHLEPVNVGINVTYNSTYESFITDDFLCSASGPTGNTFCSENTVVPFTNEKGTSGFKVTRLKTVESLEKTTEFEDTVFVFPTVVEGKNSAVYISSNELTIDNLDNLMQAANSFELL